MVLMYNSLQLMKYCDDVPFGLSDLVVFGNLIEYVKFDDENILNLGMSVNLASNEKFKLDLDCWICIDNVG